MLDITRTIRYDRTRS